MIENSEDKLMRTKATGSIAEASKSYIEMILNDLEESLRLNLIHEVNDGADPMKLTANSAKLSAVQMIRERVVRDVSRGQVAYEQLHNQGANEDEPSATNSSRYED